MAQLPPTQSAPYPTQSTEGTVVLVPPQTEDDNDDSVSEINSETKHRGLLGDYAVDSWKNGTSGMLNHIRKHCRYYPANVDKNQKIISGDKSQGNKLVARGFVQTDILEACAEMIIIDELPFSFVEKKGFRKFCSVAFHLFNVPSRRTIVRQFLKMYDEHKLKLKKDLRETRVCLTTNTWTSVQNFRYVKSSPQRLEFFKTYVDAKGLSIKGMVCMDVPTRWNSTFIMLDATLKYKKVFLRMGEDKDNPFLAYFKELEHEVDEDGVVMSNTKHIRIGPPSEDDWENATVFVTFLRVFYEVTLKVSASLHPTVNKVFHSILAIEKEIDKLFISPEMATGSEVEKVLIDMASKMREKYNKYSVKFEDMNVLLVVAIVLDPKFKLRHVTHLFKNEKFNDAEVEKKKNRDKGGVDVYTVYANSQDVDDIMDDWIKVVEESEAAVVAHEVDTYLHDHLELTTKEVFFDILLWWKLNGPKYPGLAAIAKDILAIQVSTVAYESCFSTGGRVIDAFRSSLTPRSVDALICMKNWLKRDDISINLEDEPTPKEYEFYES
ncbi:PREDICTED: zinc finger, partial [Prunus dulcis]